MGGRAPRCKLGRASSNYSYRCEAQHGRRAGVTVFCCTPGSKHHLGDGYRKEADEAWPQQQATAIHMGLCKARAHSSGHSGCSAPL